jgi:hypothetical protein
MCHRLPSRGDEFLKMFGTQPIRRVCSCRIKDILPDKLLGGSPRAFAFPPVSAVHNASAIEVTLNNPQ